MLVNRKWKEVSEKLWAEGPSIRPWNLPVLSFKRMQGVKILRISDDLWSPGRPLDEREKHYIRVVFWKEAFFLIGKLEKLEKLYLESINLFDAPADAFVALVKRLKYLDIWTFSG